MNLFKKLFGLAALFTLLLVACKKSDAPIADLSLDRETEGSFNGQRNCASYEVLQSQLREDPTLQQRMDAIEAAIAKLQQNPERNELVNGIMNINVVVNVLYRTSQENISARQIASQLKVLNDDFSGSNAEKNTSTLFDNDRVGDTKIRFNLFRVVRKATNKTSWSTNNAMKKSKQGGIDPTNPSSMLNIWVCNLGSSLLGYAQFPGGDPSTDGVVIHTKAFGTAKDSAYSLFSNYDLGRTATHEIGHWFNLRHIWGDATCGNDGVDDTPLHSGANYGCPGDHRSTCTGTPYEMWMNYMDYTYDKCMFMFSVLQADRMQKTFTAARSTY